MVSSSLSLLQSKLALYLIFTLAVPWVSSSATTPRSHIGARTHVATPVAPLDSFASNAAADAAAAAAAAAHAAHAAPRWVYSRLPYTNANRDDQEKTWPRACLKGRSQSPINIVSASAVVAPQLDGAIEPNLSVVPTMLRNSGHGFQLHFENTPASKVVP